MIGPSRAPLSPSPHIRQTKEKEETQKINKTQTDLPPSGLLLLHTLRAGLDPLLGPHLARLSLPLGNCGLVFGHPRGRGPPLPAWRRWWPLTPGGQAGLPLGSTGICPRLMGSPAVRALGRPMWARVALTHLASLDGASVVGREVVLHAEGAPGRCGQAVGSNGLPPATPSTESVWPPRLLEGVDLVSASEIRLRSCRGGQRSPPRESRLLPKKSRPCLSGNGREPSPRPATRFQLGHIPRCFPPQVPPGASVVHYPSLPRYTGSARCGFGSTSTSAGEKRLWCSCSPLGPP